MRAALITGKGIVELRTFADPTPAPGGVVVDISFCGICGTDVHAFQSGQPYTPAVCGHEWSGTVSATGADVKRLTEGDKVVVAVPPACGACEPCRAGQTSYCTSSFMHAVGTDPMAPAHGGFAPRIAVGAGRLVKADPGLDDEALAQVEPATVAYHAVRRSGLRLGDTAVVQGAGPIGLTTLQWVKAAGASDIIVVEPNRARRELALYYGATVTATPDEAGLLVKERTRGLGVDVVYECVGRPETVQSAVDLARRGGKMCLIGLSNTDAPINPATWLVKEIAVSASLAYAHEDFETAMGMMADGQVRVAAMHTSTTSLEGLEAALIDLASGASQQSKILVNPNW